MANSLLLTWLWSPACSRGTYNIRVWTIGPLTKLLYLTSWESSGWPMFIMLCKRCCASTNIIWIAIIIWQLVFVKLNNISVSPQKIQYQTGSNQKWFLLNVQGKTGKIQTSWGGAVQRWQSREEHLVHLSHWGKDRREKKKCDRTQQNVKKVTADWKGCSWVTVWTKC